MSSEQYYLVKVEQAISQQTTIYIDTIIPVSKVSRYIKNVNVPGKWYIKLVDGDILICDESSSIIQDAIKRITLDVNT